MILSGAFISHVILRLCSPDSSTLGDHWCFLNSQVLFITNLHFFALDLHGPHAEVHPDGVLLFVREGPRLEVLHHAGLPHVGVADQDDLEQEVEGIVLVGSGRVHGGRVLCPRSPPSLQTPGLRCSEAESGAGKMILKVISAWYKIPLLLLPVETSRCKVHARPVKPV